MNNARWKVVVENIDGNVVVKRAYPESETYYSVTLDPIHHWAWAGHDTFEEYLKDVVKMMQDKCDKANAALDLIEKYRGDSEERTL